MWWFYLPMAFDDFGLVMIIQEDPDGYRTLNDCTRVWRDGRVEQLGWPRVKIHYRSGTRLPVGATIEATAADGSPVVIEADAQCATPLHIGGGYGGDPDWGHGQWKGENFVERVTYDLTDPAVNGRAAFGVIDQVGRGVPRGRRHRSTRVGACSSTAASACTVRRASTTGVTSRPDISKVPSRTVKYRPWARHFDVRRLSVATLLLAKLD